MSPSQSFAVARDRTLLLAMGALAGVAAYWLVEILPDLVQNRRLLLLLVTATGGFFVTLLAAIGPLSLPRAALAACLSALPAALLLTWASTRFDTLEPFLESGHPLVAFALIVAVGLPFLIAALRPDRRWNDYPTLFTEAWNIVVRYAAAWIFTGVFWAVILLSDLLFSLVGLTLIEQLLEIDLLIYVLTGAALGLALAVVGELSDYVSPFLILRLLRLLLPVVLVVVTVFLVALPFRGLSDLFGGLSAAAVLTAMAFGIATLITSALDRRDADAVDGAAMRLSAQALALTLPVLGGVAIYAVWLRVAAYGWTPDRLAAATVGAIVMGYALLYALAVLLRRGWMDRIRRANIAMALVTLAAAALWLTPALDPQRISAANQVARYDRGAVDAERLDLWFLDRELGRAGRAATARLAARDDPGADALRARLAELSETDSRAGFAVAEATADVAAAAADLRRALVLVPEGTTLPAGALDGLPPPLLRDAAAGCGLRTPGGRPGCLAVVADFVAGLAGDEAVLFHLTSADRAAYRVLSGGPRGGPRLRSVVLAGDPETWVSPATLDLIAAGAYRLGPPDILSLDVGGAQIILQR